MPPKKSDAHCNRYDCDGAVCQCGCLQCQYARGKEIAAEDDDNPEDWEPKIVTYQDDPHDD